MENLKNVGNEKMGWLAYDLRFHPEKKEEK